MAYSWYLKWTLECVYILVVPLPESSSRPLGLWTQVSTHVQYIVSNIDLVFGLSVLDPCVSYCPSGICRCWPCEPTEDIRIFLPFYISSSCARRAVVSATFLLFSRYFQSVLFYSCHFFRFLQASSRFSTQLLTLLSSIGYSRTQFLMSCNLLA